MDSRSRSAARYVGFLVIGSVILGAALVGCSLYERATYQAYRLGIGSLPLFTPYYLARLALISVLALLLIGGLYRLRDEGAAIREHRLSSGKRIVAYGVLAATSAVVILFVVAPSLFHSIALEDGPVEWASSLLPLAASAAFLYAFGRVLRGDRDARRVTTLAFAALLAIVLFVIGMEEISWGQRIFGLATPTAFSANEQNEINLHNMYNSLLFNLAYRTGVFAGLIVLPFVVETAPRNRLFDWLADFLPSRFVLAASAPLVGFDYNLWNFFLGPLLLAIALVILASYAAAASARGDRGETALFGALAAFAVMSQTVFLTFGNGAGHTWVISEYRELLLAAGLAVYAIEVTVRLRTRYSRRAGTVVAYPTDIGGPRIA